MSLHYHCLIGRSVALSESEEVIVTFSPKKENELKSDLIGISHGVSPHSDGSANTAEFWLSYRPSEWRLVGREYIESIESLGWFEKMCIKAKCDWFVPMVKRMAAGENVPLEEIHFAYRDHNDGKEMPCGAWGTLFKADM